MRYQAQLFERERRLIDAIVECKYSYTISIEACHPGLIDAIVECKFMCNAHLEHEEED